MPAELDTYLAIALMAGVTLATRVLGALAMSRVRTTPTVVGFLESLSSSVIVAMVATIVAQGGLRDAAAVVAAAVVMLAFKSPMAAMVTGVACAALWRTGLG